MGWAMKRRGRRVGLVLALAASFFVLPHSLAQHSARPDLAVSEDIVAEAASYHALECLASWASLASYGDRVGLALRAELESLGWDIQPYRKESDRVAAKYILMKKRGEDSRYVLTVTGTSDIKDIKADLAISKVPFAGKTPEEFSKEASRTEMTSAEPLVHGGFLRYVGEAFFSRTDDEKTFGEELSDMLLADPDARLLITGHSMGGAVAVLFAARLHALGAPAERIDVVTFGAPAVGNRAFAKEYGEKLRLDRVTMEGDPVLGAMQTLNGGYAQFGRVTYLKKPRGSERFSHDMTTYADAVIRNYIDAGDSGEASFLPHQSDDDEDFEASPKVYLATEYDINDIIGDDVPYMAAATSMLLSADIPGLVVGEPGLSRSKVYERARAAGCSRVLTQRYESERLKKERNGFTITLTETISDADANILEMQSLTTDTRYMTPILAALYDVISGKKWREHALGIVS